ncbi:MAG: TIGR04086 family membrane protein [Firmicutes bacterium]|nr:TIGR04086 family membrane protein [Bacillota bacterium]
MRKNINALIKGTLFAAVITLVLVLIFAVVIKFTDINDSFIKPVNQIIKVFSIFIGVRVLFSKCQSNGFAYGAILGALYTILIFTLISFFTGFENFSQNLITDLVFGSIIGAICGVICKTSKK